MTLATLLAFHLCLTGPLDAPLHRSHCQPIDADRDGDVDLRDYAIASVNVEPEPVHPHVLGDVRHLVETVIGSDDFIQILIGDCSKISRPRKHYPSERDTDYEFQRCMFGPAVLQNVFHRSDNVCWRGDHNYDQHVDLRDWHEGLIDGWYTVLARIPDNWGETKFWLMGFQNQMGTRYEDQTDGTTISVWDGR